MAENITKLYPDKDFMFFIAGEGPMKQKIEKWILDTNLVEKFVMLGHIDNVAELLSALDIFTLTSDSKEGVPQSVIQALLMNKPLVATNIGSTKDLFCENFNLAEADENSLTEAVSDLVRNNQKRDKFVRFGRNSVLKSFSQESMVKNILRVYKGLNIKNN